MPLSDILTGRKIYSYRKFLSESQWWPEQKLLEFQLSELKKTLEFARNKTPYYQKIFNDLNINVDDFTSLRDLEQFPILTKNRINRAGTENIVNGAINKLIKESTSGSTGKQANFYLSKSAQSFTYAAQLQFFNWAGYNLGDPILQTGMSFPRGFEKKAKDILYRCQYVSAFNLTDQDVEHIFSRMKNKKVEFLLGYASSLFCIGKYILDNGYTLPLKGVISLGDMLFPQYRNTLESVFHCKVTDTYGCCEGFMIAGQCEHSRYHICMPLNIVEILDKDGNNVPYGELGRIVLTRLDNNPMPLIRYEIGDLGILAKDGSCECNRGYRMLEKILGRNTDIVVTPKGHKLIVHFFTAIFEHEEMVDQFQVLQKQRDSIRVLIVTREGFNSDVTDRIMRKIHEKCDSDIEVLFETVEKIPPTSSGKRRFVISDFSLNSNRDNEKDSEYFVYDP